ncbi:alpha/beta hydrolase [Eubacteriales bacterium OttesenSCG-928-A19]|nr:alpha/beta hydrolase [Eubacteriales bacterium OttesenSCG-928-A19]
MLVLLAVFFLIGNYFFSYALAPQRDEVAPGVAGGAVVGTSEQSESARWSSGWLNEHTEDVFLQSRDGLSLHGYFAARDGNRYAIAMHGYTGNGRSMAGFGERFYDRGFSVLLPDCRGHGESEGKYIGMGWPDRLDLLEWVNWLLARDPEAEIILYGISMGGATVMMASGEILPPQVKLIIEDCGYTSVWDEFAVQLRDQFGLPAVPVLSAASVVTRLRAGFWLEEASALEQVARADPGLPMLFIHGEKDTFVPFSMLEELYDAKRGIKEKLAVPGATHGTSSVTDPAGYWDAIDTFLDRHLDGGVMVGA